MQQRQIVIHRGIGKAREFRASERLRHDIGTILAVPKCVRHRERDGDGGSVSGEKSNWVARWLVKAPNEFAQIIDAAASITCPTQGGSRFVLQSR